MSRGEFGAEVGAPRLLELFKKYDIKTSWFIPGHTADTFPDICKEVLAAGHEIGCHGYVHENPTKATYEQETKVMQMALESLDKIGAPKPLTYRSPYWDFSPNTIKILEENRWASIFDYACTLEGACYILTTHPQTIGRAHMIQMYEQLINYMAERGAWFATAAEIGASFIPD